jgi:hypothetical protein
MRDKDITPGVVTLAAALTTVVALASWLGLSRLATPADLGPRLAAARNQVVQARGLAYRPAVGGTYAPRAVCPGLSTADLDGVRRDLVSAASPLGLSLSRVAISASDAARAGAAIAPVSVSFETEGRYDAVLTLLSQLGRAEPELFVDRLDLVPSTSSVNLRFVGKVFCWDPVGP